MDISRPVFNGLAQITYPLIDYHWLERTGIKDQGHSSLTIKANSRKRRLNIGNIGKNLIYLYFIQ